MIQRISNGFIRKLNHGSSSVQLQILKLKGYGAVGKLQMPLYEKFGIPREAPLDTLYKVRKFTIRKH